MKRIRTEDISLHHYIKNSILGSFIETDTASLMYLEEASSIESYVYGSMSTVEPLPSSLGRGWKYIDNYTDTIEQQNSVIVYDEFGSIIDRSNYIIDYIDGRIICSTNTITPTTVTYKWNYVSVVDDWSVVESSEVPIVVVEISSFTKEGFQLGAGKRVPRHINLHVFATDIAERDDIMEILYDGLYLKSCANQSFPKGTILDWNGTFNSDFEYSIIDGSSSLKFDDVQARAITVPLMTIPNRNLSMLSDINRYRGRVGFEMFHWDEGW